MQRKKLEAARKEKKRIRAILLVVAFFLFLFIVLGSASLITKHRKASLEALEKERLARQDAEEQGLLSQEDEAGTSGEVDGSAQDDGSSTSDADTLQEGSSLEDSSSDSGTLQEEDTAIPAEPVSITLSFAGDCTFGKDPTFDYDTSFNSYYDTYGSSYFMQNVKSIFEADDLTVVNFEGTLTDADTQRENRPFVFKAPPEYVDILTDGSIEACNIANNHALDYLEQGASDTKATLAANNIAYFGFQETAVVDVKGVKVGLISYYELDNGLDELDELEEKINKVKSEGTDIVVASFHWGEELDTAPNYNQRTLGRLAIDLGADLVCGHHSHRIEGIETYKGKNIVYGLANFCFGGNSSPSDMDTFIYQQTFTVTGGKTAEDLDVKIIPCSISSADYYNNYQPTPASGEDAERIMDKVNSRGYDIELDGSENSTIFQAN